MKRLERLAAALTPKRWPVRWRLAAVSAVMTFLILVMFAFVVGRLTSSRLHTDFNDDLSRSASTIASEGRITFDVFSGRQELRFRRDVNHIVRALPSTSVIQVADAQGTVSASTSPRQLPPPSSGVVQAGDLAVASAPIRTTVGSSEPLFVQYARSTQNLDDTINRLWLFLAVGVLGGTALAALAGIAIAGRAMRPIATLTNAARSIATTRDPSQRIPEPERDDEVGELARTLDQMLRELDAARSETEQMMQLQREFVADASHELRTPLTSILANLELLQERFASETDTDDEQEMVGSALRSSKRMSRLVSDLLLLARADAGRTGVRHEVDLAEVASAALAEVRPVADGHRLTISEAGPVPVQANEDELHRLAVNLLDNGLRHTPNGTEIKVAVERRNGDAILEVSDDGPGIPAGMESQIFSRFVRGSGPADVAGDSGTGLGLAIVKAVAKSHGGDVEAGPSPTGGARFTVTLPTA
jgi:two-component system, OmpR family, sensor kinase